MIVFSRKCLKEQPCLRNRTCCFKQSTTSPGQPFRTPPASQLCAGPSYSPECKFGFFKIYINIFAVFNTKFNKDVVPSVVPLRRSRLPVNRAFWRSSNRVLYLSPVSKSSPFHAASQPDIGFPYVSPDTQLEQVLPQSTTTEEPTFLDTDTIKQRTVQQICYE